MPHNVPTDGSADLSDLDMYQDLHPGYRFRLTCMVTPLYVLNGEDQELQTLVELTQAEVEDVINRPSLLAYIEEDAHKSILLSAYAGRHWPTHLPKGQWYRWHTQYHAWRKIKWDVRAHVPPAWVPMKDIIEEGMQKGSSRA
jgi:hypothetical protein